LAKFGTTKVDFLIESYSCAKTICRIVFLITSGAMLHTFSHYVGFWCGHREYLFVIESDGWWLYHWTNIFQQFVFWVT